MIIFWEMRGSISKCLQELQRILYMATPKLRVLNHRSHTFWGMVARDSISEIIIAIAMKLTPYQRPLLE